MSPEYLGKKARREVTLVRRERRESMERKRALRLRQKVTKNVPGKGRGEYQEQSNGYRREEGTARQEESRA